MISNADKLGDIKAKLSRATEHFKALDAETVNFFRGEPYKLVTEFDAKKRTYTYRAKKLKELPFTIRLLTGEVLGHLRSVLDHLTWQLALLTTNNPPTTTEFPIFKSRGDFTAKVRGRKIGALAVAAQELIE